MVFKRLFSGHPSLLTDLISTVRSPAAPITVQRVLNPGILPEGLAGKEIVLDILAEDADGQRLAIEVQLQRFQHWPQRNVYGVARSLTAQLRVGQGYRLLKPAIGILSTLITHKFDEQPDWAADRLEQASEADLKRWTLRILDAQSIEDIFK